jgi:hypothetical protein
MYSNLLQNEESAKQEICNLWRRLRQDTAYRLSCVRRTPIISATLSQFLVRPWTIGNEKCTTKIRHITSYQQRTILRRTRNNSIPRTYNVKNEKTTTSKDFSTGGGGVDYGEWGEERWMRWREADGGGVHGGTGWWARCGELKFCYFGLKVRMRTDCKKGRTRTYLSLRKLLHTSDLILVSCKSMFDWSKYYVVVSPRRMKINCPI